MTLNEYLQREGKTLDSIKKGKTLTQYIQEEKIKPYYETIDLTNSLVTDWNNRTTADYTKYGDYSSHTAQYDDFSSRSRQILSNLEKNKKLFTKEQYSEIRKLAEDIGNNSVTAKEAVQSIVDQYSAYTPAQKKYDYYTNYDIAAAEKELEEYGFSSHKPGDPFGKTRSQLQQEIFTAKYYKSKQRTYEREAEFKETFGDMTPEEVDKYEKVFTDRINEGKGNKLDAYALEWLQKYDVTYGVQSEEYYNQRLKLLNDKLAEEGAKTKTYIVYNDNPVGASTQTVHTEEYNKIKSEIEIITAARTSYVREQTFVTKGYDKYLEAEDFELYVEKHKDKNTDLIVNAYNNKEACDGLRGSPNQHPYDEYSFLKENEFFVYCYLKEKDKENGTNNAKQFCEDMEIVLDKRRQEERISEIRMEMNAGGIEGAWATVKYNALSIPANVFGGIAPAINDAVRAAMGKEINPYDTSHDAINYASATRSITTDMIDSGIGKIVYNSLMSAGDSALGAATLGKFYLIAAATTASANQAKILYEQGASSEQIFLGSIASGTIEIITEKIPLDNLLKPKKATTFLQILGEGLKQASIEGAEEMVSEIFNDVSDEVIRGAMSEFNQSVRTYKETGYSDKGAYFKAMWDSFGDILEAGLSGFISGGVTGTVKTAADSHKLKKIGEIIIEEGNIDTVLMAAKSMGELDAEIAGQVQALENNKKTTNKKGEYNAAYKRMLGKVAVSTAQSVTEVKQNVTKKAVSNELHRRGVDKKTADKVTDIVSKYVSGQNLSSAEQGYLKNNSVASNIVHEISLAQEQVKATQAGVTGSKVADSKITPSEEGYTSSAVDTAPSPQGEGLTAPEWAVSLVNQLNTIDSAAQVVNMAVTGKSVEEEKTAETNRMIKLLSIASGKTTAQQEAEAGDIPYSQYIKEKEAAAIKENTAESGEVEVSENGIYANMSEKERYEVLKDQSVKLTEFENVEEDIDYQYLEQAIKSKAEKHLNNKIKALGLLRKYNIKAIKPVFDFTMNGLRKSLFSQISYGGNYSDLAKVITNLPKLLDNAVLIETHTDKAKGTEKENKRLKQVYVMVSTLRDGNSIIPVQFEVKQHIDDENRLYVAVALTKTETGVMGNTASENQIRTSLIPVSNISLHDLFKNINPKDEDFLKYVPDGFLNEEQKQAKERALEKERVKYGKKNTDVTPSEEGYTSSTASGPPSPQGEGADIEISEADRKKQGERQEKVKSLCELFGLPLEWSDKVSRGKYNPNTRTITLNPNLTLTEMYIEVLKHEFTHDLENRKLYKNFKNYLFNNSEHFIKFCEEQVEKLKGKGIIDETATGRDAVYILRGYTYLVYKDSKELTAEEKAAFDREAAEREMICDFVAKKLLDKGNEAECIEALKELAENQRSAFDRFVDLIRNTIYHIKDAFGKTTLTDELEYLERRLKQVYESNVDKKKTAQGGDSKHSIAIDEDGYYVKIDVDQELFNGKSIKEQQDIAKNIIKQNFKNKVLKVGETGKAYVNKRSAEEYAYPASRRMDADIKENKMRAAPELDNLLAVSKFVENLPDDGRHPDAIGGWDIYKTRFEIGNTMFSGRVKVKVTERGYVFYDISQIKKLPAKSGLTASSTVAATGSSSTDIIDDNSSIVNSNSMQENEKHSLDLEENVSEREKELVPEVTNKTKTKAKKENINIPAEATELTNKYFRGELTQEEYQTKIDDLRAKAVGKYGAFKTGELAEDQTQIPKKVSDDGKVRQHVRTQLESGIMSDEIRTDVTARILQGALSYKVISNKKAQAHANWAVQNGTAVKEWEAAVNGDGKVGKEQIAVGETLLKLAAERNDAYGVMKLVAEISEMATRAGQMVQAFSMLKRMDGIGKLYYLQKCVDTINKDLEKRFGQKYADGKIKEIPQVKINETLATQLAESKTQKDFDVTYEALLQSIAEQVPVTFSDKWNAWRYFAMLFNPRTHTRNFVGNGIFLPTVRLKDVCATIIERMTLDEQKRTKSAIVKKEYRNFAQADYVNVEDIITGNGKMNPSNAIKDRQTVFDAKWLETLRKWNFDLLDKEDKIFLKKHYAHALGGFLQARNIDITKDVPMEVMEEARLYAMKEAQKATYRDASAVTDILNRISKTKVGAWNVFVEGVLPFKKTPVNIIRRGIEYSPIGLIKTLTKGTVDLKKGNISASEYIDGIAGGLTGTGIVLMGMLLSSLGFIKLTGSFGDDEEDKFDKLTGKQEYAVEIGGISYTLDWAAPVCIPFFMGVELQKALEEEGNGNLWQSIKNVGENALEPIINLSMLSGMQDVISSSNNASPGEQVGSVIWETALSYGSQLLPTIGGAVARTIDGTRRTTYIDKTSWLSDMGQMALNQIEAKIPFVSTLRSEYVDEFGRTQDNGNFFTRAIQNFVSPGYISEIENDSVIKELKELYEDTGEDTLPDKPQKYIKIGSEKVHLTAEKYEEYAKEVGQARYEYAEEFIDSRGYSDLNKSERVEVLKDLYSYALAKGKKNASKYELPNTYKKVYEAEKNGISPVDYYMSKIATNEDNADTDKSGGVSKKEKIAAIKKMDVSNDIKAALIALYS